MGDHVSRGASATRPPTETGDDRDEWRDGQITAVEKRVERSTIHGMPPLERAPATKQD